MRKLDSDFIFEREVYDLLTNGIFKDSGDFERDRVDLEKRRYDEPQENYFEVLAQRFNEYFGHPSKS